MAVAWDILENCLKESRAATKYEFVSLELPGATAEGAVKQILLVSDLPEGSADVGLEVVPPQAELLPRSHFVELVLCVLWYLVCLPV